MSFWARKRRTQTRAALLAGACLALALVALAEGSVRGAAHPARPGGDSRADAVIVRYIGPRGRLPKLARLLTTALSARGRIAAVTFVLDGRPLASVTSPPYAVDVNTALLPPGAHTLRTVAVDTLGRSSRSLPVTVSTVAEPRGVLTASPQRGLRHALEALRRGSVTVRLRPGRYEVDGLVLGSGARLVGSGPSTVLAAGSHSTTEPLLSLHGRNISVADLAIDASGQTGERPITVAVPDGSADVRLQRVRITGVHGDAVNVWGRHSDVSVQDSVIDGAGSGHAGVFALESAASRRTSVIRTRITGFRSFGIIFAQKDYGLRDAGLHALALRNEISDIRDPARAVCRSQPLEPGCGTNEIGIESGTVGAAIIGNTVSGTGWDGIETVGSSTGTSVVGNTIAETPTGIYIEHATNRSLIARNAISDVETGINVEWRYSGIGSARNVFASNSIANAAKHGLFVGVGADRNAIVRNLFERGGRPAIVLQGSSGNTVSGNRGCGMAGALVDEQPGHSDGGGLDTPAHNRLIANVDDGACGAR